MARGDADFPHDDELAAASPNPGSGNADALVAMRLALSDMPPLALLAAVSAIVHVVLFRLVLPLMTIKQVPTPNVLLVAAPFTLNLAACAGLVALSWSTVDIARAKELTHTGRRVLIGVLAGLLVYTLALSTFAPEGRVSGQLVLLATGALHTMIVQLAMASLRAQRSLAGRTTASLVAAASLFPLAALLIGHLEPLASSTLAHEGVASLFGLGELAYLLVPIAAAFVVLPWGEDSSGRFARRAGAAGVCLMAVLFGAAARLPQPLYGQVLYSTLRLEWALERASLGYAVPVSLAAGAALGASLSRDPRHRQGGAGLMLWLAAGYNPLMPSRLLMAALGASLLCRAVVSVGDARQA